MTVTADNVAIYKSVNVSNAGTNGGRAGQIPVVSGSQHNLFPRISKSERDSGTVRSRKIFLCNIDDEDGVAYELMSYLIYPSIGGDRYYISKGTQIDTQGDLTSADPAWYGVGKLNAALSAGVSTTVALSMEEDDFVFPQSGYIHISDTYATSQTIDTSVKNGQSVHYNASAATWYATTENDSIEHPYGKYLGANIVLTRQTGDHEEWLQTARYKISASAIATGTGSSAALDLSALSALYGIESQPDFLPEVTTSCGGVLRTVNIDADGVCAGYCADGRLNMSDGTWTSAIDWTTAPDNGVEVNITYYQRNYEYAGNVVTVHLESGVTVDNSYSTTDTWGAGCVYFGDIECSVSGWTETNIHGGSYDESTYPLTMYNDGTVYDEWTIQFTATGKFSVTGANEGLVASNQQTTDDCSPINDDTGIPYFTLSAGGWSGTWSNAGGTDMIQFTTNPSFAPVWLREVVPSGTSAEANNVCGWASVWSHI